MAILAGLKYRRVIAALKRAGCVVVRQGGRHTILRHPDYPRAEISIPRHRVVKQGLLVSAIKKIGLTADEFVGYYRGRGRRK